MRHPIRVVAAFLIAAFLANTLALAQPLADKVPDDAVLYVGWRGSDAMPKAYEASHLKAILEASDARRFCQEFLPAVLKRIGQEDRDAAQALELISLVTAQAAKHPTAIYIGRGDFSDPRKPMPSIAVYCDAGADAANLAGRIQQSLQQESRPSPFPVKAEAQANMVVFSIGQLPPAGKMLADSDSFKKTMAQVVAEPVAAIYLDIEKAMGVVDQLLANDRNAAQMWPKIGDALNLKGAKQLAWAGGFDGKDWMTQAFLAAPAGARHGILKLIDNKPLGDDVLKIVPRSATMMTSVQLDLAALFTELRTAIDKIDARATAQFDQALQQAREATGLDIAKDVLDPLGPAWVAYSDPTIGGSGLLGTVLVNRLRDPAAAEKSLARLEEIANAAMKQAMRRDKVTLRFERFVDGEITVHYLAAPILTPAWTIRDGNLYLSLYPQITATAARYKGASILENEQFLAARKRLGAQAATGIAFADLPRTAPQAYVSWLAVSRLAGIGDLLGIKSPPMLLPTLPKLMEHLSPAAQVTWTDDAGWHLKSISPFPGAELLGTDPVSLGSAQAAMVSVLMPSMSRSRETANRVKCASNMRQIGQGMLLFANGNRQGRYPDDLGAIVTTQDISTETFSCPSAPGDPRPPANLLKPEESAKWVNDHSAYVYLGKGKTNSTPEDVVLLYEKFDNHDGDGINVLFGDGHVEFMSIEQARKAIAGPQKH